MSASLATSRAGALERFHECLLSGASAKNAARSSHAFKKNEVKQEADMRPRRRGGYSTVKTKLTPAERDNRIKNQKTRLEGLSFKGEEGCSHQSSDTALHMLERDSLSSFWYLTNFQPGDTSCCRRKLQRRHPLISQP